MYLPSDDHADSRKLEVVLLAKHYKPSSAVPAKSITPEANWNLAPQIAPSGVSKAVIEFNVAPMKLR